MSGIPIVSAADLDQLEFATRGGLVTVVAQDAVSGQVLMVAHADRTALEETLSSGEMHYTSRSRGLWRKGATSGNTQRVVRLVTDCDRDAVLATVEPAGPACHTSAPTCFGDVAAHELAQLDRTVLERACAPGERSYTSRLLSDRNLRLKKLGEEAAEMVVACADDDRERAAAECADLFYHALVALRASGVGLSDVVAELRRRRLGSAADRQGIWSTQPT